jgi:hypothetical protein
LSLDLHMAASKKPLSRTTKEKTSAPKRRRRSAKLDAALAEAAWVEADAALADALVEFDLLGLAADRRARTDAMELLGQALSRASRRRGLTRIGRMDALEPFDAARHEPAGPMARAPKRVRVLIPGVARGMDILARARVTGVRAKR